MQQFIFFQQAQCLFGDVQTTPQSNEYLGLGAGQMGRQICDAQFKASARKAKFGEFVRFTSRPGWDDRLRMMTLLARQMRPLRDARPGLAKEGKLCSGAPRRARAIETRDRRA
jgi:hypothetical protein